MRRPTEADMSFEAFERMLRTQRAIRLVLAGMAPGATLEDARSLHRKMKQVGRKRCSFLDTDVGTRDR
jgi:hypothetical protein